METPTTIPDWNTVAERVLSFIRHHELIVALDEGVWLYSGSSESQLAALLRDLEDERIHSAGHQPR